MATCTKFACEKEAVADRPWCAEDEILTPAEQEDYRQRTLRRAAAAERWGSFTGRINTCPCGAKAVPDRDMCSSHIQSCVGRGGACPSKAFVDGCCRTHHPKRKLLDAPIEMADPTGCFECGRPTLNADATCWPCRTAAL